VRLGSRFGVQRNGRRLCELPRPRRPLILEGATRRYYRTRFLRIWGLVVKSRNAMNRRTVGRFSLAISLVLLGSRDLVGC
jgi:hypothetical protein